jgi:HEAT repeat protein
MTEIADLAFPPVRRGGHKGGRYLLLAITLAFLLSPAVASAQISADQIRERYEKNTKGANLQDFVRKFNSEDADKRLEGIKSISESKDEKALDYLLQGLGDPDMRVKAKAIDALGNIRAVEATPVLVQHLFLRSTEPAVKRRILASLGKIGDPRAAGPISEFLQRDLDPAMRGIAIFALGEIGSSESLTPLNEIQRTDGNATLRRLAGDAANKVRYHQAVLATEAKEPRVTFLEDERTRQQQQQQQQ